MIALIYRLIPICSANAGYIGVAVDMVIFSLLSAVFAPGKTITKAINKEKMDRMIDRANVFCIFLPP
jgi:hypothetical protein